MQPITTPETDQTLEVVPAIRHVVPWRVASVEPLPAMRLRVSFVNGTTGEVDLSRFLARADIQGSVFEPLCDPAFFSRVRVATGAVQWPNGADLAPDAMYDAIRERGCWIVD